MFKVPLWALLFITAIVAAVSFFVWIEPTWKLPQPFDWKNVEFSRIGVTLLGFMLIALFIERVMEVYTSIWRAPERQKKIIEAQRARVKVETVGAALKDAPRTASAPKLEAELTQATDDHHQAVAQMEKYRVDTQNCTTIYSVAVGALVALAGVRALAAIVGPIPSDSQDFGEWQRHFFNVVDIVLTAALLGGGADGIHKILSVYTKAAEEKKAEIEGRALQGGGPA